MPDSAGGAAAGGCRGGIPRLIHGNVAAHGPGYQLVRLADAIGYLAFDKLLSVETVHGDFGIRSNDDAVCFPDLLISQHILRSAGAPGFHFDKASGCPRRLFQTLGCHIGVGDTGGAGGDSQDPEGTFCSCGILCRQLIIEIWFLFVCCIYNLEKFFHSGSVFQVGGKGFVH